MITKKKILILPIILAVIIFGSAVFQSGLSFAATTKAQPAKVVGMAKFVLKGTVTAVSADTLTIHITNTSKNAKLFDSKDKVLNISSKTTLTKNGKNIRGTFPGVFKVGTKVKVFGIFDKKTGAITLVRWVKVIPSPSVMPSPSTNKKNPSAVVPPITTITKSFTVHASDTSADLTIITVSKGALVQVTFSVDANGTYHGGLDFRSSAVSTGAISPGSSKTVKFTASNSFVFTPYWPSTNIKKPYTISVVVQ